MGWANLGAVIARLAGGGKRARALERDSVAFYCPRRVPAERPSPLSTHTATIAWSRPSPDFVQGRYSRTHTWSFDGGLAVEASPSPAVVPAPYSNPAAVDPEEAFVAALASCHMLTFLYVASRAGFQVESYHDTAEGVLTKNDQGVPWVSAVTLHPVVAYGGERRPDPVAVAELHPGAHAQCSIANSVKTIVTVAP